MCSPALNVVSSSARGCRGCSSRYRVDVAVGTEYTISDAVSTTVCTMCSVIAAESPYGASGCRRRSSRCSRHSGRYSRRTILTDAVDTAGNKVCSSPPLKHLIISYVHVYMDGSMGQLTDLLTLCHTIFFFKSLNTS